MKYDVSVAPPNSIILVVGSASAEPPESMTGGLTSATSTCVAIGTLNEFDGETSVKIDGGLDHEIRNRPENALHADGNAGFQDVFQKS